MSGIDHAIVILYFAIVFGIGAYFFQRAKSSRSYFLADKSVGWIAVGASLFASNISSEHFIGLAGSGASSGLAVGHFEWLAVFMCMTLAWVFVPFYLRTNVYTMPEFLERRYGPACRWYTMSTIIAVSLTGIQWEKRPNWRSPRGVTASHTRISRHPVKAGRDRTSARMRTTSTRPISRRNGYPAG